MGELNAMNVVIVDDEPLAVARMQQLLAGIPDVRIVGQASDGESAVALMEATAPDIAFLDINMPLGDGISVARAFEARPEIGIVFVTAYDQHAVDAYDIDAIDYLLKPVTPERLKVSLARARRRLDSLKEPGASGREQPETQEAVSALPDERHVTHFWVRRRGGMTRVDIHAITWIEAARDYVILHTETKSFILRATMDSLADRLDPAVMVRVSRSAFVRRDCVVRVERQSRTSLVVALEDSTAVRVGTTFAKQISEVFSTRLAD